MEMEYTYENEDQGERYELLVTFEAVPYLPARTGTDAFYCYPAEGGYCENFTYQVVGYTRTDEHGAVVEKDPADMAARFDKLYKGSFYLRRSIEERCTELAQRY